MRASVIVLNWNTKDLTRACLEGVREHSGEHELILVDNGSTDGSREELADLADLTIYLPENKGFAGGFNEGLRAAQGDYLVILNSDTTVTAGWLDAMIGLARSQERIGLVGPRTQTPVCAPGQFRPGPGSYDDLITTERLAFFCVLIPRYVVEEVGYLDERFGLGNFEDDDYCRRLLAANYRFGIAGGAMVYHHGGATFEANQLDYDAVYQSAKTAFEAKWGPLKRPQIRHQIGIGITTRNRPEILRRCLGQFSALAPAGSKIVVVDDASDQPAERLVGEVLPAATYLYNAERLGIAGSKNRCLNELRDCEFLFLFDDDCHPVKEGWADFYIQAHRVSGSHHFCFIPRDRIAPTGLRMYGDTWVESHPWCFGVMLFLTWRVLGVAGGFGSDYQLWGTEHVGYSHRIWRTGLTCHPGPFLSLFGSEGYLEALDLPPGTGDADLDSSVSEEEKSWFGPRNQAAFHAERQNELDFAPFRIPAPVCPVVSVILAGTEERDAARVTIAALGDATRLPIEVISLRDLNSFKRRPQRHVHLPDLDSGLFASSASHTPGFLLNTAVRLARGSYLLFLAPGVRLDRGDIFKMLTTSRAMPHLGAVQPGPHDLTADLQGYEELVGACVLMPRQIFDRFGGFDEKLPGLLWRDLSQRMALEGVGNVRCAGMGVAIPAIAPPLTTQTGSAYVAKWGQLDFDPVMARKPKIWLSILVPSVPQRADTFLPRCIAALQAQIANRDDVELLVLVDNQKRTIGRKRNDLIALAQGEYVVFVDDDDRVSPHYVHWLTEAIRNNPGVDCICFDAFYSADGVPDRIVHYGLSYQNENTPEAYLRKPNHLMCFRTALARQVPYPDLSFKEDTLWGEAIFPRIRSEARVGTILYFYDYVSQDKLHPVD